MLRLHGGSGIELPGGRDERMSATQRWTTREIVGLVIHGLVAACMVLAGAGKLLGYMPLPEELARFTFVIGVGEVTTAVLLCVPRTFSAGLLLASAFWGGAICTDMIFEPSGLGFLVPTGFLAATWVGAYLRDPGVLASLRGASPR